MFNHILNIIKKLMLFVIGMVFVATIGIIIFFLLDDAGHCREQGGVWDKYEKRCRTDCLTWKEEYGGCIKLLPHQILCFEQNKYKASIRSKGPNVNEVAVSFGGGGHTQAAGFRIDFPFVHMPASYAPIPQGYLS